MSLRRRVSATATTLRRTLAMATIAMAGLAAVPDVSRAYTPASSDEMIGGWVCAVGDVVNEQLTNPTRFGVVLKGDGSYELLGVMPDGKRISGVGSWQATKGRMSDVAIRLSGTVVDKTNGDFSLDLTGDLYSAGEFGWIWQNEQTNTQAAFYCSRSS